MPIEQLIPMMRNFSLRADTIDEANRSVEAVIATEEPVLAFDMRRYETVLEVLLMSGVELPANDNAPLLDTHDRSSIEKMLGSTRQFKVQGTVLTARNFYDDDGEQGIGEKAWGLVKRKHLTDNSVGYEVLAFTDIEPGETATINGRTFTAPPTRILRITTAWKIKENSNCPIGADSMAKMRSAQNNTLPPPKTTKESTMDKELRKFLEQRGMPVGASEADAIRFYWEAEDAVRTEAPSKLDASTKPAPQPAPAQRSATTTNQPLAFDADAIRSQVRQEVTAEINAVRQEDIARCTAIRSEGAEFGVPTATIERCINEGMDISAARGEFLKDVRKAPVGAAPGINVPNRATTSERHLAAALLMRSGATDEVLKPYGEDVVNQAQENLRHISLIDVARMACANAGVDAPYDHNELLRAGFSTGTLPVILGDVAHKMMLKAFGAAGETWRTWAGTKSVSDFRDHNLFRLNLNGRLEKVANGGEVTYMERSEEATKVAADTFARNLSITRKDMINDDAGAFADAAVKLGRKAAQGVSDLVYTILLANVLNDGNGTALFSVDAHKDVDKKAIVNLQTGAALSYANLGAAVALFRKFREFNGDPIDVNPANLLVPPELETVARELTTSDTSIGWGGDTSTRKGNKNVYKQYALNVVPESRLSNTRFTNANAANWYLMPNASDADIVTVAFLNGMQSPTLNQYGLTADRLGFTWQVLFDYGAAATDKYAVKSEG